MTFRHVYSIIALSLRAISFTLEHYEHYLEVMPPSKATLYS